MEDIINHTIKFDVFTHCTVKSQRVVQLEGDHVVLGQLPGDLNTQNIAVRGENGAVRVKSIIQRGAITLSSFVKKSVDVVLNSQSTVSGILENIFPQKIMISNESGLNSILISEISSIRVDTDLSKMLTGSLEISIDGEADSEDTWNLTYLTNSLNFTTKFIIEVLDEYTAMFSSWVLAHNTSSTDFKNSTVQLFEPSQLKKFTKRKRKGSNVNVSTDTEERPKNTLSEQGILHNINIPKNSTTSFRYFPSHDVNYEYYYMARMIVNGAKQPYIDTHDQYGSRSVNLISCQKSLRFESDIEGLDSHSATIMDERENLQKNRQTASFEYSKARNNVFLNLYQEENCTVEYSRIGIQVDKRECTLSEEVKFVFKNNLETPQLMELQCDLYRTKKR
eukprot:TRINITY_DN134_c1_g1_i1.p1 TRINITY_DN134_c1_g1~~TRINITY_DN134_c1_g1_i1.p1  ORF type:complete len:393 (-),score=74.03 TRINITY_DN134_c1_g1_i1:118-1296(-)